MEFAAFLLMVLLGGLVFGFFTGTIQMYYAKYPIPTILAVVSDLVLASWLYGNIRPGFRGRLIGYQLFYGFTERGVYRRFDGILTDISHFLSEPAISAFKELALNDLNERLKDKTLPESKRKHLEKVRERLEKLKALDLRTKVRIYGCRRDFIKHIWVVLADRSIEEYSIPSWRIAFTFPFGFLRRQAVFGTRYDLRGWVKVHPYGKCKVHIFIPMIDPASRDFQAKLAVLEPAEREAIAAIGSSIMSALYLQSENRRLKNEIKAMKKRHDEMTRELARMAKALDASRTAARARALIPPSEGEARLLGFKPPAARYFELATTMLLFQVLFAAVLPRMFGLDAVVAAALGSIAGLFAFQVFVKS